MVCVLGSWMGVWVFKFYGGIVSFFMFCVHWEWRQGVFSCSEFEAVSSLIKTLVCFFLFVFILQGKYSITKSKLEITSLCNRYNLNYSKSMVWRMGLCP